jgi:hypothetical protein
MSSLRVKVKFVLSIWQMRAAKVIIIRNISFRIDLIGKDWVRIFWDWELQRVSVLERKSIKRFVIKVYRAKELEKFDD